MVKRSYPFFLSSLAVYMLMSGVVSARAVSLSHPVPNTNSVPLFAKYEIRLDLQTEAQNPFNPEEIDVEADFTSPQGRHYRVPGFLYQPFTTKMHGGHEEIVPLGPPEWMVRFAPNRAGSWSCHITARDAAGSASLPSFSFRCVSSGSPGFIRRDPHSPYLFAYSNGRPYFPVGEDMCWAGAGGSSEFQQWLSDLSAHGGNWIRLWITDIEWSGPTAGQGDNRFVGTHGVGYYALDHAWMVDRILDLAAKYHINVMLCLGTYGEFTSGGYFNEGMWAQNPYNAANGGPCQNPEDFWVNAVARKYYRQRLRYLAARFGWRTNLFGWEFWNEANPPADWVKEMGDYLKGMGAYSGSPADPYHHLVSTTYGNAAIWRLPEVDFTMSHNYGTGNILDWAPVVQQDAAENRVYGKPHFMAEFGIDWRSSDAKYDPEGKGVNLHNALWSSVVSGDAATAMIWWWDDYVAPKKLYKLFTPVAKFVAAVPWGEGVWQPALCDPPKTKSRKNVFYNAIFTPLLGWARSSQSFTLTANGEVKGGPLPTYLYSPSKPDLRTTPTFYVDFPLSGKFVLHVYQVSNFAKLRVLLDGRPVAEFYLPAAPPQNGEKAPFRSTQFEPQYNIYLATYDKDYSIDVPAGPHSITLDVIDGDWISLDGITLTHYRSAAYPPLHCYALANGKEALLWVQNANYNWKNIYKNVPIQAVEPSITVVHGLEDGEYRIVWWNTMTGQKTDGGRASSHKGSLLLTIPELTTDRAAQILPVRVAQKR